VSGRLPAAAGLLAVAGVLLGSAVAGFLLFHLVTPSRPPLRVVATTPPPESPVQSPPAQRALPEELPDVSLPDLDGASHSLRDFRGRPLMINFWATWCEPCRREIPLLEAMWRENSRKDLEIVGIAVDHPDSVRDFAHQLAIGYPVLVGEKGGLEAVQAFGMDTVLPFTVFADEKGRIVSLKIGELHQDEASFILARLKDLQQGRINLADARRRIDEEIPHLASLRAASATPSH
jgi:peroxiredoxin